MASLNGTVHAAAWLGGMLTCSCNARQVEISNNGASLYCPDPAGCIFYSPQPSLPLPMPLTITQAGSVFYESLGVLGTAFFYEASPACQHAHVKHPAHWLRCKPAHSSHVGIWIHLRRTSSSWASFMCSRVSVVGCKTAATGTEVACTCAGAVDPSALPGRYPTNARLHAHISSQLGEACGCPHHLPQSH